MQNQTPPVLYWPDWLALGVAAIALAQPWLIALWKRLLRQGIVEIYETRTIEVGFSGFGPTIALVGTLRALHQDSFIETATVLVVRSKDRAQQTLNWRAFRSSAVSLTEPDAPKLEIASGFVLSPQAPQKYNIFFASDAFTTEHQPTANAVIEQWNQFVRDEIKKLAPEWQGQVTAVLKDPALSNTLFSQYLKSSVPSDFYNSVNSQFFWHAGEYELQLTVSCARPKRDFVKRWEFTLESRDADQLHHNMITLLEELCGLPVFYHFAYPQYQPAVPNVSRTAG